MTDSDIREILEYEVGEGGSNFSLGERQLICLARAISRKPKVLLMDEATASIDEATDNTIQEMLSTQFNNITTITIAHRLKTIIHYDKILVLADGIITDFDTPINLIRKNTGNLLFTYIYIGIFYELIKESGDDFMKEMTNLAVNKD